MFYIGFDLGSSSVKAALIDSSTGKTIGVSQYPDQEMKIIAKQMDGPNKILNYGGITVVKSRKNYLRKPVFHRKVSKELVLLIKCMEW